MLWFEPAYIHHDLTHMVLYLKNVVRHSCVTLVQPAKTAVRLPEQERNGEEGQNAGNKSGSGGDLGFNRQSQEV